VCFSPRLFCLVARFACAKAAYTAWQMRRACALWSIRRFQQFASSLRCVLLTRCR